MAGAGGGTAPPRRRSGRCFWGGPQNRATIWGDHRGPSLSRWKSAVACGPRRPSRPYLDVGAFPRPLSAPAPLSTPSSSARCADASPTGSSWGWTRRTGGWPLTAGPACWIWKRWLWPATRPRRGAPIIYTDIARDGTQSGPRSGGHRGGGPRRGNSGDRLRRGRLGRGHPAAAGAGIPGVDGAVVGTRALRRAR